MPDNRLISTLYWRLRNRNNNAKWYGLIMDGIQRGTEALTELAANYPELEVRFNAKRIDLL